MHQPRQGKSKKMDYLVDTLKGMIDKNIIVNKEGKESFNLRIKH